MANQDFYWVPSEDYLAGELASRIKHEYRDGQIYAMAGATDAHITVSLNLAALLRSHIRGTGCRVFIADMKARIESANCYYYPDVMVTCDERDQTLSTFKRHPCLIVEVLSDSTEAFDRGDKFEDYQKLESLQEYVLISQKRERVDCFRRNREGRWVLYSYKAGDKLHLDSVDFHCGIEALYEDVSFPEPPPTPADDSSERLA